MAEPHQQLGLHHDATPAQIRRAYRQSAARHHPDRGGDPATFAAITAARDELLDGRGEGQDEDLLYEAAQDPSASRAAPDPLWFLHHDRQPRR